ncbi:MAG: hypothetical protein F6K23_00900 [Okeania sp. SIO2C9]|nr:hypothetical protein [Okeania sp. SIO2C9]NEQ71764.1 hypothetical protein [Okeania sp. SIO2C9]
MVHIVVLSEKSLSPDWKIFRLSSQKNFLGDRLFPKKHLQAFLQLKH